MNMPLDVNPIDIIQIDATLIVGVLILLTITKFAREIGEDLPKSVLWIVAPFAISASFALLSLLIQNNVELILVAAILMTMLGFLLTMLTVHDLTKKPQKKS